MKNQDSKILRKRQQKLKRRQWSARKRPMLTARNTHYEMADRIRGMDCGGISAFHLLARNTGLIQALDRQVAVLKRHLPYHESDHILNIGYNDWTRTFLLTFYSIRQLRLT